MHEDDWYSPPLQQAKEQAQVENVMDANEKGFHCTRLEAVFQHELHAATPEVKTRQRKYRKEKVFLMFDNEPLKTALVG